MPPKSATPKKAPAAAPAAPVEKPKEIVPEPVPEPKKKKRNLMVSVLGIDISSARCAGHMRASLTPADLELALTTKREEMEAAKAKATAEGRVAKDDADVVALKGQIDEITAQIVRIGGDAPIAMAALADWIAKSLIRRAMDQTIAANGKMVEIAALHAGDPQSLDVWPLVCDLPSITSYDPETENALRLERTADNKAVKEAREAAKKAKEAGEPVPAKAAKAAKKAEDEDEDGEHGPGTSFDTYVDNATKKVKEEAAYSGMRVTQRVRDVVTSVVAEFVARFSKAAKVTVLETLKVRTLSAEHLMSIAKTVFVMKTGVEDGEAMQALLDFVAEKVQLFREHQLAEKGRKIDEMSDEKKAELQAKKAAAEEAKLKRTAEATKRKAIEMANKAKELQAKVGGK